ncbi:hypothetical protein [Rhizobium sp. LEGMi135b]
MLQLSRYSIPESMTYISGAAASSERFGIAFREKWIDIGQLESLPSKRELCVSLLPTLTPEEIERVIATFSNDKVEFIHSIGEVQSKFANGLMGCVTTGIAFSDMKSIKLKEDEVHDIKYLALNDVDLKTKPNIPNLQIVSGVWSDNFKVLFGGDLYSLNIFRLKDSALGQSMNGKRLDSFRITNGSITEFPAIDNLFVRSVTLFSNKKLKTIKNLINVKGVEEVCIMYCKNISDFDILLDMRELRKVLVGGSISSEIASELTLKFRGAGVEVMQMN